VRYKIVKLYETNYHFAKTESFGAVDVRLSGTETRSEAAAALDSLESYEIEHEGKNLIRLVTIVEGSGFAEALHEANILFEETADLVKRYPVAKISQCSGAGYFVDLDTGTVAAFRKSEKPRDLLGNLFHVNYGPYAKVNAQQYIAAGREDELVKAYFRAINWFNKSRSQSRRYLRFLFSWISFETVSKVENNTSIVPRISMVMGFPRGADVRKLSPSFLGKLNNVKDYKAWKDYVYKHLEESRELRNQLVHSGFKETDLVEEDIKKKQYIVDYAYHNMIDYLERIVLEGIRTIEDAWDKMPSMIESNENIATQLEGSFIYMLNNPDTREPFDEGSD